MTRFKTIDEANEILRIYEEGSNQDLKDLPEDERIAVIAYRLQNENDPSPFVKLVNPVAAERRKRENALRGVNRARVASTPFQALRDGVCFRGELKL